MRFAIITCFIISSLMSFAQRYNIEIIGLKDGLLHSLVTGIDQDKQGKVWLSTGGGLCNYNGFEFKYLTTRDGINNTRLTDVAVDAEGNIWASSSLGLNMVRGDRILTIPKDTIGEVASLGKSNQGVWVLSNKGVFRVAYSKEKFEIIQYSLPVNLSLALSPIFQDRPLTDFVFQSSLNQVYVGHKGSLYKLSNGTFIPLTFKPSVYVNACNENANGDVLIATSNGLFKLVDDKPVKINHPYASRIDILKFVCIGSKIWCNGKLKGSDEVSIHAFDLEDNSFNRVLGIRNGLPDTPSKLFVDHELNIWILTNNGIAILKGEAFTCLTTNDGLIGNKIWGICRVSDGTLWAGTIGEGLSVMSPTRIYQYSTQNGLPDNYVGKIFESSCRKIYVGTSNAGLNLATYMNSTLGYSFERLPLLPKDRVRIDDIAEDHQKRIWVATSKGLFYAINGINFSHFPLFDGDTGGVFIQKLLIDTLRMRMWVGTRFNGVFYIENKKVFQFSGIDKNAEISTIAQDSKGDIWFGTRNSGVFHYDGSNIKQIKETDGISSNLIYVLYADNDYLWIGTNLGLDRLSLSEYSRGKIDLRHYGSSEGLPDLEINLNGVLADGEDGFWIATNGGLAHYQKSLDKINSIAPKVSITNLLLRSQPTPWADYTPDIDELTGLPLHLKLGYWQNHITFEFAGVSFKNPQGVKYAWFLEGLDNSWVESKNRQAVYSNLLPGKTYRLHLKAANSDGIWSDEVVSMPIYIAPPLWATWWFRLLVVIGLGVLIYWYVNNRIQFLKKRQEELEDMVEQRTVELREQLDIVDDKNRQIMDSIMYAKFLQTSMLPNVDDFKRYFNDAFIFYRPKDFVSGDFYWFCHHNDISVFAVADCTGHGVPGAIVSVICENALRNAVRECNYQNPAQILTITNVQVEEFFTQSQKSIHDGMEIALAIFNHHTLELDFCGAKLPLYYTSYGEVIKLKPDIYRIGWDTQKVVYSNRRVKLAKGDLIFAFTDGFCDQFGAETGQKFSSARLKNLLLDNSQQPHAYIEQVLSITFEQWRGFNEQTDDVLVMGVKI